MVSGVLTVEVCREQVIIILSWEDHIRKGHEGHRIVQNHPGCPKRACADLIYEAKREYERLRESSLEEVRSAG